MTDIERIILEQTDQRKAEMACELNRWQWPVELAQFKPATYGTERGDYANGIGIIRFIEHIIGRKAFLQEWNKDNMTAQEFEDWFKEDGLIM